MSKRSDENENSGYNGNEHKRLDAIEAIGKQLGEAEPGVPARLRQRIAADLVDRLMDLEAHGLGQPIAEGVKDWLATVSATEMLGSYRRAAPPQRPQAADPLSQELARGMGVDLAPAADRKGDPLIAEVQRGMQVSS